MTTHELAAGLEQLAAELRERPNLETGFEPINEKWPVCIDKYTSEKSVLFDFARIGNVTKMYDNEHLSLFFGSGPVKLKLYGDRSRVCRLVKAAEYDCEPLLTPQEEAAL